MIGLYINKTGSLYKQNRQFTGVKVMEFQSETIRRLVRMGKNSVYIVWQPIYYKVNGEKLQLIRLALSKNMTHKPVPQSDCPTLTASRHRMTMTTERK